MDNLMHSTLEEIALWVKTVELPASQTDQPETETFYEDDTTEESQPLQRSSRNHKERGTNQLYLSPLETLLLAAFLMQTSQSQLHTIPTND
jgi:hypothetical protein